eukprot:329272-Pleurochrysis_carterae.AAC.1
MFKASGLPASLKDEILCHNCIGWGHVAKDKRGKPVCPSAVKPRRPGVLKPTNPLVYKFSVRSVVACYRTRFVPLCSNTFNQSTDHFLVLTSIIQTLSLFFGLWLFVVLIHSVFAVLCSHTRARDATRRVGAAVAADSPSRPPHRATSRLSHQSQLVATSGSLRASLLTLSAITHSSPGRMLPTTKDPLIVGAGLDPL